MVWALFRVQDGPYRWAKVRLYFWICITLSGMEIAAVLRPCDQIQCSQHYGTLPSTLMRSFTIDSAL